MCRNTKVDRPGEFFKGWSQAALDDWTSMEFAHAHAANVVLFSEREEANGLYVVLEASVRISINSSEGKRLSLRIARKGDVLGLSSAMSGHALRDHGGDAVSDAGGAHQSTRFSWGSWRGTRRFT